MNEDSPELQPTEPAIRERELETLGATQLGEGASEPTRAGELTAGTRVGRYVVLERVGAGGMGVVYRAYDPELERRIALKLLHAQGEWRGPSPAGDDTEGRQRLTREAQAMARLEHPNTITVHDVGEHQGRVYVAMEFVDGETLRQWLEAPRRWRAILDIFVQAGRGLAAAHEQKLVHRDFKPDNVMLGRDQRVRVMDFGLARPTAAAAPEAAAEGDANRTHEAQRVLSGDTSDLTQVGTIVGTPAYMAPEQHLCQTVGPPADQFAFCVALWEALYGQRPFAGETIAALAFNVTQGTIRNPPRNATPSWIRAALVRGLSEKEADRFPSMRALLEHLERGQARRKRRLVGAGVAAVALAAATGFAIDSSQRAAQRRSCEAMASLDGIWDDERSEAIQVALRDSGVPGAVPVSERTVQWLDRWAGDYQTAALEACADWSTEPAKAETWARAQDCFSERRFELESLLTELEIADVPAVRRAVGAAAGLRGADQCADARRLDIYTPLPEDKQAEARELVAALSTINGRRLTGHFEGALELALEAEAQAQALDHPPLLARAKFSLGITYARQAKDAEARDVLIEAFEIGGSDVAPEVAVRSARELAGITGFRLGNPEVGLTWDRAANVIAREHGLDTPTDGLSRATNMASVYFALGQPELGVELFDEVLPPAEQALGADHPSVGKAMINYANLVRAQGDLERAGEIYARAIELTRAAFGPDNPSVATATMNLGTIEHAAGNLDRAAELYNRSVEIREVALGDDSPTLITSLLNLAAVHTERDDPATAKPSVERALEIARQHYGDKHPKSAECIEALAAVNLQAGEHELAEDGFKQALTIRESLTRDDDPSLAYALTGLAEVSIARGQPSEGRFAAERAVSLLQETEGRQDHLGKAYFALAQTLWAESEQAGPARARALATARKAETTLEAIGESRAKQEVADWLEARGG